MPCVDICNYGIVDSPLGLVYLFSLALKGRTPSEAAGIRVEGENKWLTLIQNASKKEPTKK